MFTTTFDTSFDEVKKNIPPVPINQNRQTPKSKKGWKLSILALIIAGVFALGSLTGGSTLTYASNFFTKEDLAGMAKCGGNNYLAGICNNKGGQVNIMVPASSSSPKSVDSFTQTRNDAAADQKAQPSKSASSNSSNPKSTTINSSSSAAANVPTTCK